MRVFNFSGGQTSAYMVIRYYQPGDLVVFCDTGREHQSTYKFIADFEAYEGIRVVRIAAAEGDAFRHMIVATQKGKALPNRMRRFCTDILKIRTCHRYLREVVGLKEWISVVGFRADERERVKRRKVRRGITDWFPLYEDGVNKAMIDHYWASKPYRLQIPRILGNCTLCFMKGKNALLAILRDYPELADVWIEDEEILSANGKNYTYIEGWPMSKLKAMSQHHLFAGKDLGELNPAYNCACTT